MNRFLIPMLVLAASAAPAMAMGATGLRADIAAGDHAIAARHYTAAAHDFGRAETIALNQAAAGDQSASAIASDPAVMALAEARVAAMRHQGHAAIADARRALPT